MIRDLFSTIQNAFTPEVFKHLRSIKINHVLELEYCKIIEDIFNENCIKFIRNVNKYPDYQFINGKALEIKSSRTKYIKLNDSIPCSNVDYLIINLKLERLDLLSCEELISEEDKQQLIRNKDEIKSYKKNGKVSMYPRVNIKIKYM